MDYVHIRKYHLVVVLLPRRRTDSIHIRKYHFYRCFPSQVGLYAGALFIQQSVGWNLYLSIFGLLALTGICTITGERV